MFGLTVQIVDQPSGGARLGVTGVAVNSSVPWLARFPGWEQHLARDDVHFSSLPCCTHTISRRRHFFFFFRRSRRRLNSRCFSSPSSTAERQTTTQTTSRMRISDEDTSIIMNLTE